MYSITYYNNETSLTAYYCWESDDHWVLFLSVYQLLTLFVVPAVLMLGCYFCVIRELWASTKVITTLTSHNANGMRVHKDGQSYLVRWPSKRLTCSSTCYSTSSQGNSKTSAENSFDFMHAPSRQTARSPVTDIRNARKQVTALFDTCSRV